jgi:FxsC-like protein
MTFWFFTSYTSADRDPYLEQFFGDLRNAVRTRLGGSAESISFLDTRSIEAADQWENILADALRTSRLCVAICSPSYLLSPYCGKEYQVFCERRDSWLRDHPGELARVIFPVLWVPPTGELPAAISSLQYSHDDFPALYAKEGLQYLMRLNRFKDDYEQFVLRLAQKLVDAGRASPLPELTELRPLTDVPSAFNRATLTVVPSQPEADDPNKVCFVFVVARRSELAGLRTSLDGYYHEAGWHWRPYHPDTDDTVGLLAQEIACRLKLRYVELDLDENLPDRLRDLERAKEPVIFLADAWSVRLERYAGPMRKYDESTLANCAVLVPWNCADSDTKAELETLKVAVQRAFPRKFLLRPPGHHWDSINSAKDLREKLEAVLTQVRMTILRVAAVQRRAESEELSQAALQQGIALGNQPSLTGPVGGSR